MAFPGAELIDFNAHPIVPIAYDELEQVALVRAFLNSPNNYLRRL